jgi:hypothetical protein
MCEPCAPDALLEAVRGLRVAEPDLGLKPLLAKLRDQQPELGAATKEVREALATLKAESEAVAKAAASPPAAVKRGAPSDVALSLRCIGCLRLPSEMPDGREKHPICDKCLELKLPTTYLCGMSCPGNPGAWELHGVFHKKLRKDWKRLEDGGAAQQRAREVAEKQARHAAQTGDAYDELLAKGTRYAAKEDWRKAGKAYREAIALKPDKPTAYHNLGIVLNNSGHYVEGAQRFLEARERVPVGSERWARATAAALNRLKLEECAEVAKPEWWNDEGLKALSATVVRALPNDQLTTLMRADVLYAACGSWEAGPRSAAELMKAVTHFEQTAALTHAPAAKAALAGSAEECRSKALGVQAALQALSAEKGKRLQRVASQTDNVLRAKVPVCLITVPAGYLLTYLRVRQGGPTRTSADASVPRLAGFSLSNRSLARQDGLVHVLASPARRDARPRERSRARVAAATTRPQEAELRTGLACRPAARAQAPAAAACDRGHAERGQVDAREPALQGQHELVGVAPACARLAECWHHARPSRVPLRVGRHALSRLGHRRRRGPRRHRQGPQRAA